MRFLMILFIIIASNNVSSNDSLDLDRDVWTFYENNKEKVCDLQEGVLVVQNYFFSKVIMPIYDASDIGTEIIIEEAELLAQGQLSDFFINKKLGPLSNENRPLYKLYYEGSIVHFKGGMVVDYSIINNELVLIYGIEEKGIRFKLSGLNSIRNKSSKEKNLIEGGR
jgi:hypothetical protein